MKKYICFIAVICLLAALLSSCALFDTGDRFVGGEPLDDDMMIDIWMEIFSSEPEYPDEFLETDKPQSEEEESDHETEPFDGTVYWVKGGKVWHTHDDCGSLKDSSDVLSGSIEDALEAGKERICSRCEDRDNS